MRGGFSRPLPPLVLSGRETTNTIVRVAFVAHGFYVIEGRGLCFFLLMNLVGHGVNAFRLMS